MLTIKLKIKQPTKNKLESLQEYCQEFSACVNWHLKKLQKEKTTSRTKIHKLYYQFARHKFNLPSANLQVALDKAIEIQRSYLRKKGKKSKPKLKSLIGCFRDDTLKKENNAIRLTLKEKKLNNRRIWLPLTIPQRYKETFNLPIARSEVKEVRNKWFLYLAVKDVPEEQNRVSNVLGVDLGVAKIAVVSNPEGTVNKFFRGEPLRFKRNHFLNKRKELQENKDNKKCKSAWRVLKKLSDKEKRWQTDLNHKISREIVNLAKETNSAIAVENLLGIRGRIKAVKKVRRMLHNWSFRQLTNFIQYKARLVGIPFVTVDPRKTSRTCIKCNSEEKRNRKSQSSFKCSGCGYSLNADLLASRNVALRAITSQLVNLSGNAGLDTPPMQSTATSNSI